MTQQKIAIVASLSPEPRGEGRPETGVLYLRLGQRSFPARDWTDFPIVVLGGWSMWLFEILCTARRTATLGFMEGSYELKVTRSGDVLRIKAREGFSNGSREHWAGDVAVLQLLDAMSAAYQSVAMDAARYGYVGPAIQLLERERDCLSTVATHLRNAETSRKESAKYS